jgi:heme-degrading monooxygenase HmoA
VYIIVWEFRVRNDGTPAFIQGYGSAGGWVRLFQRGEGYVGTELTRSVKDPQLFYTLDTWQSEAGYAEFRKAFGDEYRALDESFEGLTEHERLIGTIKSE